MRTRHAVPGDADGLAEVLVRGWQEGYRGLIPQEHLDALSVTDKARVWRTRIAQLQPPQAIYVLEPGVAGFVTVGAGVVMAIYVHPERWGEGGGQALMAAASEHLRGYGYTEATLWVLESNARARRFYEAAGWRLDGAAQTDRGYGFPLEEVRYRRRLG